jgi:branched-chain amino acid transport system substrate-binding protein
METRGQAGPQPDARREETTPSDSVTRGFLFSDLRGYAQFVETRGAASAASLLDRYRALVREAIRRFGGAEIKTEGDSFYVVFSSVSTAVRCALVITGSAIAEAAQHPGEPIRVGVGVHAGETIETAEGYVGSPVNIAARICAQAGPNEVLVSETVRALTRTVLPVRFESRGRRQLKGIAEPLAVYAAIETEPGAVPWAEPQRRRGRVSRRQLAVGIPILTLVALAVIGSLLFRALGGPGATPSPALGGPGATPFPALAAALPPGTWKIGLVMPLTGNEADLGVRLRNAVELAIDDANGSGGIFAGSRLKLVTSDDGDSSAGGEDPGKGAASAQEMAGDGTTVAVIGPLNSWVAEAMIPVTNAVGLLQCSPSNTNPALTKPRFGALDRRSPHPTVINFVRIAPSDDIQGQALAKYAFNDLGARRALVIDDAADVGRTIADGFQEPYEKLGGTVTRRALNPGADPMLVLGDLSAGSEAPAVVFFGGFTGTGAIGVRKAMVSSGHAAVPLLSWDGLFDGSGADKGSYIQRAGANVAVGTLLSHAAQPPALQAFLDRCHAAYGSEPNESVGSISDEFAAAAYACAQVIIESLQKVATGRPSASHLREAVRAWAVDPGHAYQTVVSDVAFDANGDNVHQYVAFYRVDPTAQGGKGDWVIAHQADYGPPP